jgi:hypothetical protein
MEKDRDMVHSIIVKEESMLAIGNKIKCMEKVFFIIQTNKLPMMVNGNMTNFLVMVHFTMNKLLV